MVVYCHFQLQSVLSNLAFFIMASSGFLELTGLFMTALGTCTFSCITLIYSAVLAQVLVELPQKKREETQDSRLPSFALQFHCSEIITQVWECLCEEEYYGIAQRPKVQETEKLAKQILCFTVTTTEAVMNMLTVDKGQNKLLCIAFTNLILQNLTTREEHFSKDTVPAQS